MGKIEAMFNAIEKVDVGRYDMNSDEMKALYDRYKEDPFRMAYRAYKYGFVKGRRAEKAAARGQ